MVRLIEKIDTSVTTASRNSTRNVPTIEMPATASGSPAATTLPNTKISRISMMGKAIVSARCEVGLDLGADLPEHLRRRPRRRRSDRPAV